MLGRLSRGVRVAIVHAEDDEDASDSSFDEDDTRGNAGLSDDTDSTGASVDDLTSLYSGSDD